MKDLCFELQLKIFTWLVGEKAITRRGTSVINNTTREFCSQQVGLTAVCLGWRDSLDLRVLGLYLPRPSAAKIRHPHTILQKLIHRLRNLRSIVFDTREDNTLEPRLKLGNFEDDMAFFPVLKITLDDPPISGCVDDAVGESLSSFNGVFGLIASPGHLHRILLWDSPGVAVAHLAVRLRVLCLSDSPHLFDKEVDLAVSQSPNLREIYLHNCPGVSNPSSLAETFGASTANRLISQKTKCWLGLDGCWGMDRNLLGALHERTMDKSDPLEVDLYQRRGNLRLASKTAVQVVILTGRHQGTWVDAHVKDVQPAYNSMTNIEGLPCYTIFVEETHEYDNAVGFSGRCAFDIQRHYLRHLDPRTNQDSRASRILSSMEC